MVKWMEDHALALVLLVLYTALMVYPGWRGNRLRLPA